MPCAGPQDVPTRTVGQDPGWQLAFDAGGDRVLAFSSGDYRASLEASLQSGLQPGAFTFTVEGLVDAHYGALARALSAATPTRPLEARLYLFWNDVNADVLGYLANITGLQSLLGGGTPSDDALVAVLAVTELTRVAAGVRYDTQVGARELVYHRLATSRLTSAITATTPLDNARQVAEAAGLPADTVHTYPPAAGAPDLGRDATATTDTLDPGERHSDLLQQLGVRMERQYQRWGRGMYRIRDGQLDIGPGRPIPTGSDVRHLMAANGLLDVHRRGSVIRDPSFDFVASPETLEAPTRDRYELILRGRPDLKPGDVVCFVPPALDQADTGSFYGDILSGDVGILPGASEDWSRSLQVYVEAVSHSLGTRSGFLSALTGVVVADEADYWDVHSHPIELVDHEPPATGATAADAVAGELVRIARTASGRRLPEVGELRTFRATGDGHPPRQTGDYLRGLAAADGQPSQARRLAIDRESPGRPAGVPYLTPFAWGQYGLVLPRYPGTRVLLVHRNGFPTDALDVGAFWPSERDGSVGPAEAKPGDWWLCLPADRPEDEDLAAPEGTDAVALPAGRTASNDLIDAQGRRIIETRQLNIRVSKDGAPEVGWRPVLDSEEDGAVTVEHVDSGSKITMKPDGTIEIHAAADLVLKADQDVRIEANNVRVKLGSGGSMDVEE